MFPQVLRSGVVPDMAPGGAEARVRLLPHTTHSHIHHCHNHMCLILLAAGEKHTRLTTRPTRQLGAICLIQLWTTWTSLTITSIHLEPLLLGIVLDLLKTTVFYLKNWKLNKPWINLQHLHLISKMRLQRRGKVKHVKKGLCLYLQQEKTIMAAHLPMHKLTLLQNLTLKSRKKTIWNHPQLWTIPLSLHLSNHQLQFKSNHTSPLLPYPIGLL